MGANFVENFKKHFVTPSRNTRRVLLGWMLDDVLWWTEEYRVGDLKNGKKPNKPVEPHFYPKKRGVYHAKTKSPTKSPLPFRTPLATAKPLGVAGNCREFRTSRGA